MEHPNIMAALQQTDEDVLKLYGDGKPVGWVPLIWGNDCDLVSNYSGNPVIDALMHPIIKALGYATGRDNTKSRPCAAR